MKRWVYIAAFLFAAILIFRAVYKMEHREMPDSLFYLFSVSACVFFFLLIFTTLQKRRNK